MKKAFDQTVRDIRREVNKKVLKVPGIEQKVLDATSNEPWGPHGSLLADIAQATRNYHEYQMIMAVIWKRINDTGKNWRHVYKGLTVLEYLVAHGSERVIDEIREHAYQISTLSDFQYIDSSGRDQGNNVRKKSQSLVVLVNDKERIQEARQKAAANRDKFRNTSMGGMYRPGDRYDDDRYEGRYGSRDDDRDGYGREREWGSRDDDRYGRHGDSYGRDRDRYGRDSDEGYGRDGYREDDYSGRSRNIDEYQYGSRSRSSDRERDHANEDDGQYSSRGGGARADDHSQDARGSAARADDQIQDGSFPARQLDRKLSEQSLGVPPSYEDAVGEARSPVDSGRNRDTVAVSVPQASIPYTSASPNQATTTPGMPAALSPASSAAPVNKEVDGFDEFDPRGSFSAAQTTSSAAEVDLLGSLSESFSSSPLAIVPVTATTTASGDDASANFNSAPSFSVAQSVSTVTNQPFEDPFGDGPFRALPSTDGVSAPPQNIAPTTSFHPSANQSSELPQSVPGIAYTPSSNVDPQLPNANSQFSPQEPLSSNQDTDILAGILPPAAPPPPLTLQTGFPLQASQPISMTGFSTPAGQPATVRDFPAQASQPAPQTGFPSQASNPTAQPVFPAQTGQHQLPTGFPAQVVQPTSQPGFVVQTAQPASLTSFPAQTVAGFPGQFASASETGFPAPSSQPAQPSGNIYGNFLQQGSTAPAAPNVASQTTSGPTPQFNTTTFLPHSGPAGGLAGQHNNNLLSNNALPQAQQTAMATQSAVPSSAGSLAIVPQPAKDKFEPKSAVWADTLSRGLVNFNISGSKINPLADIGIDFDAINRKEKRMEKPTTAAVTSTVTMGKAMGSGSGIGRAGASVIRAPPNPTLGMGMGMGMGGGAVMGMGAYGGVNQPMGAGMGMNIPVNMGMGMNMGMGQGAQMQPGGFPPGSIVPGGYNPMISRGGYPPQQPYGSGYR